MASTINASSTGSGGLISTGDSSGTLELQANGTTKLSVASTGVSITGGIASPLEVTGNSTAGAEIRLPEDTDNGSNYVALKAADSIASNVTFTLPAADGTSGQVIQTNGSGTLSFATPASGALVYIASATASNSATVSFTNIGATYDLYAIEIIQAVPATSNLMYIRTSTNNGLSYASGASDYQYNGDGNSSGSPTVSAYGSNGNSALYITEKSVASTATNANSTGASGWIYLFKPSEAKYCSFMWFVTNFTGATSISYCNGSGARYSAADVDAIQFAFDSGNISSGTFRLYGVANS